MRKQSFKRLGSALLALVMLISSASGLAVPARADSWPNDTASAEPTFAGYRVKDIENWSPETDPYAEFLVASVPLQERNEPFAATQAKPYLNSDAQVMNMTGDYGNSFFGSTMYTNEFSEDVMTFWQYSDYFSPWHGAATAYTPEALYDPVTSDWRSRGFEFGIVNIPNPAYTNAAHRNGVMSIACIYFDPAFRPGQTCADMLTNKEGDVYVVAKKLVEMAEYYGFDGYFLNQEEGSYAEFKPFMAWLTAQGLYTQWYDTNSTFNSSKAAWLKDDTYGQIHNSVFVNYSGFSGIDSQLSYAESIGVDPHAEIFYGVECNQADFGGGHYSATSMTNLYDATGNPRASYALFCGSDRYHRGLEGLNTSGDGESVPTAQKDSYQWMSEERERMFWSGVMEDPTNTGFKSGYSRPDVAVNDADGWVGVADFIAERSVIDGSAFYTNFNTGHGMQYFVDGAVSKDEEWTNINIQEQMPTWQWWFESTDSTKLHADFDYGSALVNKTVTGAVKEMDYEQVGAFNGGSSLAVYGDLSGTDTMHLFKTDLAVSETTSASLTFKKVSIDDAVMKLGLIFADDAENIIAVDLDSTAAAGDWTTVTADLSAYAGRQIAAICLIFEGVAGKYQINIGNITISDGTYTPDAPEGFVIDTAYADGQMIVRWEMADYAEVVQYNLYGKMTDGSRIFLGGIYGDILYVKNTFCDDVIELQLVAVGIDGSESEPAVITYDYTDKVSNVTVLEGSSGNGLTTQAANVGKIEVSFEAPAAGKPDSYELEVKLHNIESDDPYNRTYTATADGDATSAVVSVAAREGYEYDLKIYAVRDGVRGEAIAYRGLSNDAFSEPIAAEDIVISGSSVRLVDPDSHDWYRMTATFDGSQVASFKRGASSGNSMRFSLRSNTGLLSVVVEDYSGNFSEPTVLQLENGAVVDPTDLIGAEQIPDPALLSAVRTQVGITLTALNEYVGELDLSGTAVSDLTGLELIPGLTAIDFSDCAYLEEISGLTNPNLNEIIISGCSALKVLDVSGLGLEKLVGEGEFNALTFVDISDNRLDLSTGTPERSFLEGLNAAEVQFGDQRPVPYSAVYTITEPIVREVANETLDMTAYADITATIRGTDYASLGAELIDGVSFLADDVDLNAKPVEAFAIVISDQNRMPIEGSVIDLSFDATWTVLYKLDGEIAATLTVIVGDGGKVTTPELMTENVTILYATTVSGQVASEMPIFAFDGDDGTKWCPGGNAIQAELSIDVGAWYTLTEVTIIHAGHLESGRNTVDFAFQVLKDTEPTAEQLADNAYLTNDDNWVTVASYTGNTANQTIITFDEPVVGRYFRLDVTKGDNSAQWPSTRIYEWSMMGVPADAPEIDVPVVDNETLQAVREAQAAAEAAQEAAEEAQRKADEAAAAAEEAAEYAAEDREAAEAAQREAEEAQTAAEEAAAAAEEALAAAQAAEEAAAAHDAAAVAAAAEAAKRAQEVAELYEQIADTKAEMAQHLAEILKAAEDAKADREKAEAAELACAKYYAMVQLVQYVDPHDYDDATAELIAKAIEDGIDSIEAAESVAAVEEALAEAKAAIDQILTQNPFTDVPADSFYADAVEWALKEGITTGTSATTFSPDKTVTRAEAVTFLWRAAGEPEPATTVNPFVDVAETDFFYKAVLWASENGITDGVDATHFAPLTTANRAQIVTFLWRAMEKPAAEAENPFTDVAESDWFYESVLWAVENGITSGMTETAFGPDGLCNRAQMVTFLYRAYA